MTARAKPHATGKTKPGDVSERVGVEQIRSRGVNVEQLLEKLIDAAGAEFTTYYYYTILRMYLAGNEDYKEICEDARSVSPRIFVSSRTARAARTLIFPPIRRRPTF